MLEQIITAKDESGGLGRWLRTGVSVMVPRDEHPSTKGMQIWFSPGSPLHLFQCYLDEKTPDGPLDSTLASFWAAGLDGDHSVAVK